MLRKQKLLIPTLLVCLTVACSLSFGAEETNRLSRIQGTVLEGPRTGLPGVQIRIQSVDQPNKLWLTTTDRRGRFRVEGFTDGTYSVSFSRAGYRPVSKEGIKVQFPFRAIVEQTLTPYPEATTVAYTPEIKNGVLTDQTLNIAGKVVSVDLEPLEEVSVRMVHVLGAQDPRDDQTNAEGQFGLMAPDGGPWSLTVQSVGFLPVRQVLTVNQSELDLQVVLAPLPPDYAPTVLELLPVEQPTKPRWSIEFPPLSPEPSAEAIAVESEPGAGTADEAAETANPE